MLNKVLKGTALLTPSTHKLATALLSQETPSAWLSQWEGPEDPSTYLRTLVAKALALGTWQEKSGRGLLLKEGILDLSELFNPATFLNALRQETARLVDDCDCMCQSLLLLLGYFMHMVCVIVRF